MIQTLFNDTQKNDTILGQAASIHMRGVSIASNDTSDENSVYLRIWSIENQLVYDEKFQSYSNIAQSVSQGHFAHCIASRIWTWERIKEEITSTLRQQLGYVPHNQPLNSCQTSTCFYYCSKDEILPQSIPFPTLSESILEKMAEYNSRTADLVQNNLKIEGNCTSSIPCKLYPIIHRIDFWNAIQAYENNDTNIKWMVNMVVFCQPSEQSGGIKQLDNFDLNIDHILLKSSIQMKMNAPFGKRTHVNSLLPKNEGTVICANEGDNSMILSKIFTSSCASTIREECPLKGNHRQIQNEVYDTAESIGLKEQEKHKLLSSQTQSITELSNVINRQKQNIESSLIGPRITTHDRPTLNLESTVLSRDMFPSTKDCSSIRIDSSLLPIRDVHSHYIGRVAGSINTHNQIIGLRTNDDDTLTLLESDHKFMHVCTNISKMKQKKKGEEKSKTPANNFKTSNVSNTKSRDESKVSTDRGKRVLFDTSFFHPYDVICHPRRTALQNIGNRRLEILIEMAASHYDAAMDKVTRSKVVDSVVDNIHEAGGKFFRWCQIRGYVLASRFLACLTVREKFDEALVFRGRPSQERSLYQILKVQDSATS
jgi:hypothetical protein